MTKTLPVLALLLFLSLQALAADGYSAVIEDLPLMPGMTENTDDAVVFDKPAGRIIDTVATTREAPASVREFYAQSLPPLGWQAAGGAYQREDETLKISTEEKSGTTTVHFNLTPKE